jgi:DNA-directed RNA polymerase subunit RPC12/RpoP
MNNSLAVQNPELAKQWHPTKNGELTPDDITMGSGKKIWWLGDCGHEWEAIISDRHRGNKCPFCANKRLLKGFNDLASVNPELAKQWHPTKNGGLTPCDVLAGSCKKYWWICSKNHEWQARVFDRAKGNGCPFCINKRIIRGFNDLATINPKVAAQWHPTKNGKLTPYMVAPNCNKKAWWICDKGHVWEAKIAKRNKGMGCPVCLLIHKKYDTLAAENPELALQWHPTKNNGLTPEDVTAGSSRKAWWVCGEGHEWEAKIKDRNKGNGCPCCSNKRVLKGYNDLATINPQIAKQWNYKKNGEITPEMVAPISSKKYWWVCGEGHEWEAKIADRHRGDGCPYCSGKRVIAGVNDAATLNPGLAKQWHPTKNGELALSMFSQHSGKKCWWICPHGHEWEAKIAARSKGDSCPICCGRQVLKGYNDLVTTNPELAKQWHPDKNGGLTPEEVTAGSNRKIWWICGDGHEWEAVISGRNQGDGCPVCWRIKRKSQNK